ncbi:nucleotidyltransferase domain-containing protein [Pseudomonas sp. MTM4]|uniref:nucleotidyltransferase domain-containing protein n=1 Tax=unclassified Pseudomonas TaxID=196821 RepID=UPI0018D22E7D|nr:MULTISPECIES: nucleotidyltransferase domain-containing protein [unclassified Pseudomonas]MBC8651638.1 nucleotidyltransferase domain-containing protein [Pseudomonas sp. MT4]QXY91336.1 nucleotidyltransferase domain-containing protein [Pseudomonas sp. MTM4]
MILEDTGLSQSDVQSIQEALRQFPKVSEAILYGSRAKRNYRPGSDIDLTLKGDGLSHQDLLDIELAIDDLLLPYKVDLSLHYQIDNSQLIDHIARVGKQFYKVTD